MKSGLIFILHCLILFYPLCFGVFQEGETMRQAFAVLFIVCCAALSAAQTQPVSEVKQFARVDSPVTALEHVRVIDGTGAAAKPDQTIVISGGKSTAIGNSGSVQVPADANRMAFTSSSAVPGLDGMDDHLSYPAGRRR